MSRTTDMMAGVITILAIAGLCFGVAKAYDEITQPGDAPEYQGYYIDEDRWSAVALPDSAMVCTIEPATEPGPTHVRCLKLPPGSIVLIPTPEGK